MCNCWPEGIKYLYGKAVQYGPCTLSQRPKYFKGMQQVCGRNQNAPNLSTGSPRIRLPVMWYLAPMVVVRSAGAAVAWGSAVVFE